MKRIGGSMTLVPLFGVALFAVVSVFTVAPAHGQVTVKVEAKLVASDLSLKPVPKHVLHVFSEGAAERLLQEVTTSFDGEATVSLPVGKYIIQSKEALVFENKTFTWRIPFEIASSSPPKIELSNDNAQIESSNTTDTGFISRVYESAQGAVVTVESESGQGSGFLVDSQGLVLTNAHVVEGSRFFAVALSDAERFLAELVCDDPQEDLAVLRIHPDIAAKMTVLELAGDTPEKPPVKVGQQVVAIGSPLSQKKVISSGVIGQVETGALISDVMIDHGNSGGPLLNADGKVVGVNTFGEGRGISGTVRIWKAYPLLEQARTQINSMKVPSASPLPPYPDSRFPADAAEAIALNEEFDLEDYKVSTKRFDVYFLTPPAKAYFEHAGQIEASKGRTKRRDRKELEGEDTYDPITIPGWTRYVGELRPIVEIVVLPRYKATPGSKLGVGLLAGLTGVAPTGLLKYRYVGDFDSVKLRRGTEDIPYIRVCRSPLPQYFAAQHGHMKDVAYMGSVQYLPDPFDPVLAEGKKVTLEIRNEADPDKNAVVELKDKLLERLWNDFAPMRVPVTTAVNP